MNAVEKEMGGKTHAIVGEISVAIISNDQSFFKQ